MKRSLQENTSFAETTYQAAGVKVGKIMSAKPAGRVLVDFPGNNRGPVEARTTTSVRARMASKADLVGSEVLLVFEGDDPGLPVIIDTLYSLVDEISAATPSTVEMEEPDEVLVDGERITFDAKKEIVLRCGEASITLTRAGKVLIRGTYVVSRSSGANKMKGASIALN